MEKKRGILPVSGMMFTGLDPESRTKMAGMKKSAQPTAITNNQRRITVSDMAVGLGGVMFRGLDADSKASISKDCIKEPKQSQKEIQTETSTIQKSLSTIKNELGIEKAIPASGGMGAGPGGKERAGHKYIRREWDAKASKWNYIYKDEQGKEYKAGEPSHEQKQAKIGESIAAANQEMIERRQSEKLWDSADSTQREKWLKETGSHTSDATMSWDELMQQGGSQADIISDKMRDIVIQKRKERYAQIQEKTKPEEPNVDPTKEDIIGKMEKWAEGGTKGKKISPDIMNLISKYGIEKINAVIEEHNKKLEAEEKPKAEEKSESKPEVEKLKDEKLVKEKEATKYVDIIMNDKKSINTLWGIKRNEGIKEMLLSGDEKAIEAIMNGKDKIKTSFGDKTIEGIKDMAKRIKG